MSYCFMAIDFQFQNIKSVLEMETMGETATQYYVRNDIGLYIKKVKMGNVVIHILP